MYVLCFNSWKSKAPLKVSLSLSNSTETDEFLWKWNTVCGLFWIIDGISNADWLVGWMLRMLHLRGQRVVSNQQGSWHPVDQKMTTSPDVEELSTTGQTTSLNLFTGKITTSRRAKTDHIVLREWLFQHRYNAYPTRAETLILAMKTELTTKQVRTWFINARRRILPETGGKGAGEVHQDKNVFQFLLLNTRHGPYFFYFLLLLPMLRKNCPLSTSVPSYIYNLCWPWSTPGPLPQTLKESISTQWSSRHDPTRSGQF